MLVLIQTITGLNFGRSENAIDDEGNYRDQNNVKTLNGNDEKTKNIVLSCTKSFTIVL